MARVFNVCFEHQKKSYTALVSISGNHEDNSSVRVTTNNETIQILLPSGRLVFSISDVVQRILTLPHSDKNVTLYITDHISLQLLNTKW
jgi:hypothetical protein